MASVDPDEAQLSKLAKKMLATPHKDRDKAKASRASDADYVAPDLQRFGVSLPVDGGLIAFDRKTALSMLWLTKPLGICCFMDRQSNRMLNF